jgi:cation diffusion facilitator CzcD-associated flavoprotein CzcO
MTEAIVIGAGILLGGLAIAYGLQVRAEFHERDRWRRFQQAMKAGGLDHPLPKKED